MISAVPVWPAGREKERNLQLGFRASFRLSDTNAPVRLQLAAASRYRAFVNGQFVGHGPARGPHGHPRVDEWDLATFVHRGENVVAIEVAGYNANSFYVLDEPSFLRAEVLVGGAPVAATGAGGAFTAIPLPERVQKVQRYSFQRPFSEVWRLYPGADRWRTAAEPGRGAVPLAVQPESPLLPHRAPLPTFALKTPTRVLSQGALQRVPAPERPWKDRSLTGIGPQLIGYPEAELDVVPSLELQALKSVHAQDRDTPYDGDWSALLAETWQILDFGRNVTGFPGLKVRCEQPTTLDLTFDEILSEGDVDFKRLGCVNIVRYELEPGEYALESFEPYTLRYLKLAARGGDCRVGGVTLRELACPDADRARFSCSDPQIEQIFEAARQTYRQNAVDAFMDCPHRERAGWLCDSFFTARVALDLTGHTQIERCFLENYALPPSFAHLPEGMVPMCYPADHYDGVFIPNWALWLVVQLEEYRARGGDPALIEALKPRVLKLFDYFRPFRNDDGLLEKLQSWIFVEWSRANEFVQDVNYPTNMLFAAALDAAGRLYGLPALTADATKVRAAIQAQSFDGTFFVDNAQRKEGKLERTTNRTETCQYYAFFFGAATPQSHPALWKALLDEFGPERKARGAHPEVHPSNAFIGNYLRMELLARAGRAAQILQETRSFFGYMAERTGTLWENVDAAASCNHGFASHVAHVLYRDILGVRLDHVARTVRIKVSDAPLTSCSGTLPVEGGAVTVRWTKTDGKAKVEHTVPKGWKVVE